MDEIHEEELFEVSFFCPQCSEDRDFWDWCDWGEMCRWCCEECCCEGEM